MSDDVIELNGKRYDAITGALLGKSTTKPVPVSAPSHGRVIDGFIRPSHPAVRKPKPAAVTEVSMPKKTEPARHVPAHSPEPKPAAHKPAEHVKHRMHHAAPRIKPHQPEHAKTLMRRAVHKPEAHLKPAIKTQAPAEMMAKPESSLLERKHSVSHIDPSRKARAERIARHQAVRRFHTVHAGITTTVPNVITSTAHVPVIAVKPAPQVQPISRPVTHKAHADIFEAAISRADSHKQIGHKSHRRGHRRLVNTLAVIAAFFVIGGFVAYQTLPSLELRVASMQVGFHVSMPSYSPTGYALDGNAQRSGGTVSLKFRSGDSHYILTQQASDWNSQTLLDNTLALSGPHDTVQRNGQTIYIYGNGANASWVNGGVRYDIIGNAQLSNDEIATIATSL